MSILIEGIEIPKSPELFCIHPDGKVFTALDGGWRECKAVPVPPHGRLIDADALIKSDRMVGKLMMIGGEYVYTQSEIDRAPTIILASE